MVFVSALCVKSSATVFSLKKLGRRITRLLLPMWIFQTLYWLIFYKLETPSLYTIIQSYALLDLTPYTWIIRVFLILACLSPLLVRMANRLNNIIYIYILFIILIAAQEILCYSYAHYAILHVPVVRIFIRDYILYAIPYSLFFVSAVFLKKVGRKIQIRTMLFTAILLIFATLYFLLDSNEWKTKLWLSLYKFPPRYMYTLYGLFCVQLLYLFKEYYAVIGRCKLIRWISENSLWIYFYHIPLVTYFPFDMISILSSSYAVVLRWMIVITLASCLVVLQNRIIGIIKNIKSSS